MRIENEAIDKLKREVDLVALVRAHGVKLKKRGSTWVGLCPFHDDGTPSFTVNPRNNLYHCFGCPTGDSGGNAITFLMKRKALTFPQAFEELTGAKKRSNREIEKHARAEDQRVRVRREKLLGRVVAYYRRSFEEKPGAREYLAGRGIEDNAALQAYGAGYCDGTLLSIAPDDPQVRGDLEALGILTGRGRELFGGCVTFPLLDENKQPVGLYGRRLEDGEVNHLYLPGPRRGLVNRSGAAGSVVLCESVLDALTLSSHGIQAVPCYGVEGFTDEHAALLNRKQVSEVIVAFDGDEAGRRAAEAVSGRLREKAITVRIAELPDGQDINAIVVRDGIDGLRDLLGLAPPASTLSSPTTTYEPTRHGFVLRRDERAYEVKAISRQATQLRVTLKASAAHRDRFELATVDLYSHRSRAWFASLAAKLFEVEEATGRSDLTEVLARVEAHETDPKQESAVELSDAERTEAQRFLESPRLLDEVAEDLEVIGYTGERTNKLICFLTAISRKLEEPLSVLIQSRSAAGKSALQEAILALVPDEDALHYSRLTDQALFYQAEDAMVHKLLAIEEAEGMGGAAYSIRAMQSAKKLKVAATGKDPTTGKMKTEEYTVRGPVAVMLTTTRTDFDQETLSRFLCLTVDESAAMTRRIHEAQRLQDTLEGLLKTKTAERIARKHHNAQRLLEPLSVVNPYAPALTFPSDSLKSRRDHKKYLGLIKAVALLRQKQRAIKEVEHEGERVRYIEATLDDIAVANDLAAEVLAQSQSDLTPQASRLLVCITELVKEKGNGEARPCFSRRELREHSRWSDWQVKTHLAELVELEHVYVRQGQRGKEYLYQSAESAAEHGAVLGLTPTDRLVERLSQLGGEKRQLEVGKGQLAELGGRQNQTHSGKKKGESRRVGGRGERNRENKKRSARHVHSAECHR